MLQAVGNMSFVGLEACGFRVGCATVSGFVCLLKVLGFRSSAHRLCFRVLGLRVQGLGFRIYRV